jgi:hypothetical protein
MHHGLGHPTDDFLVYRFGVFKVKLAADAAHEIKNRSQKKDNTKKKAEFRSQESEGK